MHGLTPSGENPWTAHVSPEQLKERLPIRLFGVELATREREVELARPFMARFGDIARIEIRAADILVTLKSGTVFVLDLMSADDLADGVRVWDASRGALDLNERQIRTIEFLPHASSDPAPYRLQGTVRTRQGEFTGFVQWTRSQPQRWLQS